MFEHSELWHLPSPNQEMITTSNGAADYTLKLTVHHAERKRANDLITTDAAHHIPYSRFLSSVNRQEVMSSF